MKTKVIIAHFFLFVSIAFFSFIISDSLTDNLLNNSLKSDSNIDFNFSSIRKNKAAVFIFLSPECPLCQSYTLTINNFQKKYQLQNIPFYCVFSGRLYSQKEIADFKIKYKMQTVFIFDEENIISKQFGANVTPEAFVLSSQGNKIYSGSIDNWAYTVGSKRTIITEFYLRDALDAVIKNTPIKVKYVKAVGCLIQ